MAPNYPFEKDYFRKIDPATIVQQVATTTLATISEYPEEVLAYIGWSNNPIIDILYSLTSAGVWIANTDASGRLTEANSSSISSNTSSILYGHFATTPTVMGQTVTTINSAVAAGFYHRRVAMIPYTLAGGVQANLVLVPDPAAAYYPVIDGIIILPVDAIAGGLIMAFESPAGTAIGDPVNSGPLVAQTPNNNLRDLVMYNGTDNEALVVDLSGGAAAESGRLIVFYHYET